MRAVQLLLSSFVVALSCDAVPAFAADCTTIPRNAINPCGSESAASVATWTQNGGAVSFASGLGENGSAARGTAQNFSGLWSFSMRSPCFAVVPGQFVPLGYSVSLASGVAPSCTAGWQEWQTTFCTTPNGGAIGGNPVVPGVGYSPVPDSHTVRASAGSMQLIIDCRGSGAFEVLVDNAYAIVPSCPWLDIDCNGTADALTDGLLVIRYLFGLRGAALIQGAVGAGAKRTSATEIETYIQSLVQ